ncbi:MAG: hypothetical protein U1E73_12555 [Planctomycetota bacterium]
MSRPSPMASTTWIAGLPLPGRDPAAGFRIELAIEPEAPQPFVSLGDTGRFSRVILARLAGPGGDTVQLLALKLQRDAYRALGGASPDVVDNREIEAMWRREHASLQRLGDHGGARLVAAGTDDGVLPPLAFDRGTRRLFRVVSPLSWAPLATCRDDALLRDAGLEPWTTTTVRYLHCAKDHAGAEPGAFYTWSTQDGREAQRGTRVRRRHDLFRDLVTAFAQLTPDQRALVQRELPDLGAVLGDLTVDAVEQRIVPLSYYEGHALFTAAQHVHFDEFCDLAGGADLAAACRATMNPGREVVLAPLAARFAGERQWLGAAWVRGDGVAALADDPERARRLGLEAAWLKLQAWIETCRAVAGHHRELGVPHLGLSSDNVMLSFAGTGRAAFPARWGGEVALVDLGCSHRRALAGLGEGIDALCLPGGDAVRTFASPWLEPAAMRRELTMQASATLLAGETKGLALVLRSARERLDEVALGDVVEVVPDGPLPATGERPLLGRVTAVTRDGATAEVLLGDGPLPAEPFAFAATATFHRRLQTPADLFGLGMLLARALLVHDERDVFAVRELWDRMLDKLAMMLAGNKTADPDRVAATVRNILDAERDNLASAAVLWPAPLRAEAPDPVPAALWRDLLLLIARLLTGYPGFAFAAHHGDVTAAAPDRPLLAVLAEAEELLAALQIELFEAGPRDAELAAIAGELAREATAAMAGRGEAP